MNFLNLIFKLNYKCITMSSVKYYFYFQISFGPPGRGRRLLAKPSALRALKETLRIPKLGLMAWHRNFISDAGRTPSLFGISYNRFLPLSISPFSLNVTLCNAYLRLHIICYAVIYLLNQGQLEAMRIAFSRSWCLSPVILM